MIHYGQGLDWDNEKLKKDSVRKGDQTVHEERVVKLCFQPAGFVLR